MSWLKVTGRAAGLRVPGRRRAGTRRRRPRAAAPPLRASFQGRDRAADRRSWCGEARPFPRRSRGARPRGRGPSGPAGSARSRRSGRRCGPGRRDGGRPPPDEDGRLRRDPGAREPHQVVARVRSAVEAVAERLGVPPDRLGRLGGVGVHQPEARRPGEAVVDPAQLGGVPVGDRAVGAHEHEDGRRAGRARAGRQRVGRRGPRAGPRPGRPRSLPTRCRPAAEKTPPPSSSRHHTARLARGDVGSDRHQTREGGEAGASPLRSTRQRVRTANATRTAGSASGRWAPCW